MESIKYFPGIMNDITLTSKEYITGETGEQLTLASKEYVDSKITEYPENSFVFFYKDNDGNKKGFDATNSTDGTSLFENNQNIAVDWAANLPTLTKAENMFKGSNIKSFTSTIPQNTNSAGMFANCKNLEYADTDIPLKVVSSKPIKTYGVALPNSFNGCTSLKEVKLKKSNDLTTGLTNFVASSLFADCTNLESVDIDFRIANTCLYVTFTDMFKNCKSLKSVNLNLSVVNRLYPLECTGMFSGCLLGPEQLQQILDWKWPSTTYVQRSPITIGVDSTKVSQEDIDNYWHEAIGNKGFTITWELNTPE